MKSRPPPQKLRQRGILRERVFGCDLGEHLHNSGHEGEFTVQLYLEGFSDCFMVAQILTEYSFFVRHISINSARYGKTVQYLPREV